MNAIPENRLSVPFYEEMVRCTFSQPPPIERVGHTTGGSFLRILIKATQGQLSRKNTKNRLYVPFYGEMVCCTFSQPPPIERAGQTTGGSFLRILIKVTQGHPKSIIKVKPPKSTSCTFLWRDDALHVLATTTNRKNGSNYRWVLPPNFH